MNLEEISKLAEYAKGVNDLYTQMGRLLDPNSHWLREDTDKKYLRGFLAANVKYLDNFLDVIPQDKKNDVSDIVLCLLEKPLSMAEKSEMLAIKYKEGKISSTLTAAWKIFSREYDLYVVIQSDGYYIGNAFHGGQMPIIYLVKGDIKAYFNEIKDSKIPDQQISLKEFGKKHKELHKNNTKC